MRREEKMGEDNNWEQGSKRVMGMNGVSLFSDSFALVLPARWA